MEKECDIVEDLLFGYNDETLNETSREFVKKHLENCEKCKKILEEIKKESEEESQDIEIDYLKKINKKGNKKTALIIFIAILLIIVLVFNIMVFINYNNTQSQMEIFLEVGISSVEKEQLEKILRSDEYDAEITYHSSEEALEKMKENLGESGYLLESYTSENNIFPSSYVVKARKEEIKNIENAVKDMECIKKITTNINYNPYEMFLGKLFTNKF